MIKKYALINTRKYYLEFVRLKSTIGLHVCNRDTLEVTTPLIQITTKDPWYLPKIDLHYLDKEKSTSKTTGWLAGWLFFYFGVMHQEIIIREN